MIGTTLGHYVLNTASLGITANYVRCDTRWEPLRRSPRYLALLGEE